MLMPRALPRIWENCGPGCRVAPVVPDLGVELEVTVPGTAAGVRDGVFHLRTASYWPGGDPGPEGLYLSVRLDDDAIIAAARSTGCLATSSFDDAASMFNVLADGAILAGSYEQAPRSTVRWRSRTVELGSINTSGFATDEFWGMLGYNGSLWWGLWSSETFEIVASTPGGSFTSAARRDLVVWSAPDGQWPTGTVRGFWPGDRRVSKLVRDELWSAMSVALTPTRLVWTAATGPRHLDGNAEAVRLRWAELRETAREVAGVSELVVPVSAVNSHLVAGSDFAAFEACSGGDALSDPLEVCRIYVAKLSEKKLWTLRHRSGNQFVDALAMDDRRMLLSEMNPSPAGPRSFQRLVMIDLERLDELEVLEDRLP